MHEDDTAFDLWNQLKKALQSQKDAPISFPKEGEVWMGSLGKNIGYEQNGGGSNFSRPLLIIKKFNNHMFWCIPLSTKQKGFDFYFNFTDPHGKKVAAILAQMKLVSVQRLHRKMYEIPNNVLAAAKDTLIRFLA